MINKDLDYILFSSSCKYDREQCRFRHFHRLRSFLQQNALSNFQKLFAFKSRSFFLSSSFRSLHAHTKCVLLPPRNYLFDESVFVRPLIIHFVQHVVELTQRNRKKKNENRNPAFVIHIESLANRHILQCGSLFLSWFFFFIKEHGRSALFFAFHFVRFLFNFRSELRFHLFSSVFFFYCRSFFS